jgi:hypothetical protein
MKWINARPGHWVGTASTEPPTRVLVLEIEADGPEPGDYIGYMSVHATPEGVVACLVTHLDSVGVIQDAELLAKQIKAVGDDGSFSAELVSEDGVTVSRYGCRTLLVQP